MTRSLRVFAVPSAIVLSIVFAAGPSALKAENWPQWRGPLGNGISTETNLPTEWSPGKNIAWRTEMPGPAGATPVIWGDRIFLTSVDGEDLLLIGMNTDGEKLWQQKVGRGNKDVRGDEGNSASPSPLTDGEHVWTFMANGDLACYDFDGNQVWGFNLQDRYGEFKIQFGMTSTPVLHGGRLYLQVLHGDYQKETQEGYVIALDKSNGDEVWKQARVTGAYGENEHSYASPVIYNYGDLEYLITHGADFAIAYDLEDGTEIWRCGGLNPQDDPDRQYHPTLRFVASPGVARGIIVIPTAKNGPVVALKADISGDVTTSQNAHLWTRADNTPDVPSPLIHGGLVYLCRENGNLLCLEAQTGEEIYHERTHRSRHRASPVFADGKIYLTARDGVITVVKAGREFEILSQNNMQQAISASPAISDGTIYLRSFGTLWAVRAE